MDLPRRVHSAAGRERCQQHRRAALSPHRARVRAHAAHPLPPLLPLHLAHARALPPHRAHRALPRGQAAHAPAAATAVRGQRAECDQPGHEDRHVARRLHRRGVLPAHGRRPHLERLLRGN